MSAHFVSSALIMGPQCQKFANKSLNYMSVSTPIRAEYLFSCHLPDTSHQR